MKEQICLKRKLGTAAVSLALATTILTGCSVDKADGSDTPEAVAADSNSELAEQEKETDISVPGVPRDLTAFAGDGQVELTWSVPYSDGGAVTGYEVSSSGGSPYIAASSAGGHTFGSLENDVTYEFRVRAVNEEGAGDYAVISATPSSIIVPQTVGEIFADSTGFMWRVLTVGDGKALIITEHIHGMNTRYHSEDGFLPFQNAEIAQTLNAWFNNDNFVSPGLRARALPYAFQLDDGTLGGNGVENQASEWENIPSATNQRQARTVPGDYGGGDMAFILSTSEVSHYFANDIEGRAALRISETGEVGAAAYWWLRSPSASAVNPIWLVGGTGYTYYDPATYVNEHVGFRPAFWVTP